MFWHNNIVYHYRNTEIKTLTNMAMMKNFCKRFIMNITYFQLARLTFSVPKYKILVEIYISSYYYDNVF